MNAGPNKSVAIANALMQHIIDRTTCEGLQVTGWPEATANGRRMTMRGGKVQAEPRTGQFLPRAPYRIVPARGVLRGRFDASKFA